MDLLTLLLSNKLTVILRDQIRMSHFCFMFFKRNLFLWWPLHIKSRLSFNKSFWKSERLSNRIPLRVKAWKLISEKSFLNLVKKKHFSKYHKLQKIINTNIFQETYFCMKNMSSIIKHHKFKCCSEQHQTAHVTLEIKIVVLRRKMSKTLFDLQSRSAQRKRS